MAEDYYNILGVSKGANQEEIKRAYRKLAHEHHPDKGNGNAEKFKKINEAYQVLGNEEKRKAYDTYGSNFQNFQQGGGFDYQSANGGGNPFGGFDFGGFNNSNGVEFDLGDIFGDLFGGGRTQSGSRRARGIDLEMTITLSFEESIFGVTKTLTLEKKDNCVRCKGSGAEPDTQLKTCPKCHGQGQIRSIRRTIFGNMESRATCDRCGGLGKIPEVPCTVCKGAGILRQEKKIEVKIPAGIENGQRVRVGGEGEVGYKGSMPGDLYLLIKVSPSREFSRDDVNLLKDVPVSFVQAALGTKLLVKTLDGDIELKIPEGTQPGAVFKIKGKGVPYIDQPDRRGDLLITIRVVVPSKLTKKEKDLLKGLAEERGESVEVDEGFWNNIRESF